MASVMSFDSVPMGSELGMVVASPYTEPRVVKLALRLKKADCIEVHNGKPLGKMPLRRAFPNVASAWRTKARQTRSSLPVRCPLLPVCRIIDGEIEKSGKMVPTNWPLWDLCKCLHANACAEHNKAMEQQLNVLIRKKKKITLQIEVTFLH
jgi:hypothetical protein